MRVVYRRARAQRTTVQYHTIIPYSQTSHESRGEAYHHEVGCDLLSHYTVLFVVFVLLNKPLCCSGKWHDTHRLIASGKGGERDIRHSAFHVFPDPSDFTLFYLLRLKSPVLTISQTSSPLVLTHFTHLNSTVTHLHAHPFCRGDKLAC